jgi:hypothetical protein
MSKADFSGVATKTGGMSAVPLLFAPTREVRYNLPMIAIINDLSGAGRTRTPSKAGFSRPRALS